MKCNAQCTGTHTPEPASIPTAGPDVYICASDQASDGTKPELTDESYEQLKLNEKESN
jgi:hypothetical protein